MISRWAKAVFVASIGVVPYRLGAPALRRLPAVFGITFAMCSVIALSIVSGLHLPSSVQLSGYPAESSVFGSRLTDGIAPVSQRLLSAVLGGDAGNASQSSDGVSEPAILLPSRSPWTSATLGAIDRTHAFTNDQFEHAYVVPALPFVGRTNTSSGTRQPGEPTSCSKVGGTSWYRYTATMDGDLFANTFGTDYADALAVFTGNSLRSLRGLGCNTSSVGSAQVGFAASEGNTYYFQVTGIATGGHSVFSLNLLGRTERVSVSSTGSGTTYPYGARRDSTLIGLYSHRDSISADGRYVVFNSTASNLDPAHPPPPPGVCPISVNESLNSLSPSGCSEVYLRDRFAHTTEMVSRGTSGEVPNGSSSYGTISADGRYIAFSSEASNIVSGDTNALTDVFVRDRLTGEVARASVGPTGQEASSTDPHHLGSDVPAFSADGRFLVFDSDATNFGVANDCAARYLAGLAGCTQPYSKDLVTGKLQLVAGLPGGRVADQDVFNGGLSADGSVVAFGSNSAAWGQPCSTVGGSNGAGTCHYQTYVWERATQKVTCVSCHNGFFGNDDTLLGGVSPDDALSADGRYVGFASRASNLVDGDTNGIADGFLFDRRTGVMTRVSVNSQGEQQAAVGSVDPTNVVLGTGPSQGTYRVSLSADGRFVAFDSQSGNLTPGDTNNDYDVFVRDNRTRAVTRVSLLTTGSGASASLPMLSADGSVVVFEDYMVRSDGDNVVDVYAHALTDGQP